MLRADTNLQKDHGFAPNEAHAIVQAALSAVSNINSDFSQMREHTAVVGIAEEDRALFDANLEFLWNAQNPERQFSRASRVIELAGLPDLSDAAKQGNVDLVKLLEIRDTPECKQFREFVWSAEKLSDDEIRQMVASLRAKISAKVYSKAGKLVRFLTTSGLGTLADLAVPVAGGATIGALDTFVVEKLFPGKGVLTFLGQQYPSVFTD